jgi:GTP cyclohydrolase II
MSPYSPFLLQGIWRARTPASTGNGEVIHHNLNSSAMGSLQISVARDWPQTSGGFAAILGSPQMENPLVRIQSRCVYGEVLGSTQCDCGLQLARSRELLIEHGGILIYLDQEGRGAGLAIKAAAYAAHEKYGVDSFDFYNARGLPGDLRRYELAAALLGEMNVAHIRLLTNNPEKVSALFASGIDVERIPLVVDCSRDAADYIESKRRHGYVI